MDVLRMDMKICFIETNKVEKKLAEPMRHLSCNIDIPIQGKPEYKIL